MTEEVIHLSQSESAIRNAINGDRDALNSFLKSIMNLIFDLSLKMLWNPSDAEDATQEILIRVANNLKTFRFESKISTWVYRIASNYLIGIKRGKKRILFLSDEKIKNLTSSAEPGIEEKTEMRLLREDIKIACTNAMFQVLPQKDRLIILLSLLFGLNSVEGAEVIGITPENFRKRLSRARIRIRQKMFERCGKANENISCACPSIVCNILKSEPVDSDICISIQGYSALEKMENSARILSDLGEFEKTASILQGHSFFPGEKKMTGIIQDLIDNGFGSGTEKLLKQ